MRIETIKPGQVFMNKRQHIVTMHGKHVCYIDIPHDAIVYTLLDRIKSDDWELFVPASQEIVEELDNVFESTIPIKEKELSSDIEVATVIKKRGRPPKNKVS